MYRILGLSFACLMLYTSWVMALSQNQSDQQYTDQCAQQIAIKIKKPLPCPSHQELDLGGKRRTKVHHVRTTDVTTTNKEVHYLVTDWKKGEKNKNCYPCPKMAPLPVDEIWQCVSGQDQGQAQKDATGCWNMQTTPQVQEVILRDKETVIEDNHQEDTQTIVTESCVRTINDWWDEEEEEDLAPGCAVKLCSQPQ
jgi:hypothetical protein